MSRTRRNDDVGQRPTVAIDASPALAAYGPPTRAIPAEIRARFREAAPQAIAVLEAALLSPDERIRIEAARTLLDRALGKPHQSQSIEVSASSERVESAHERLAALSDEEIARRATQDTAGD